VLAHEGDEAHHRADESAVDYEATLWHVDDFEQRVAQR
jgi:hypothetical protein